MNTVFLTGGTGFLGSHFLVNFIGREVDHAYVLIRGNNEESRREKLITALTKARNSYVNSPSIEDIIANITIVHGDIGQKDFGVSPEIIKKIKNENVRFFWHFAASLNFEDFKREHIYSTNVDGAFYAVDFCGSINIGRFIYVSTAYTCGTQNGLIPEELHSLNRSYSNFYEESKCNAEHLIFKKCNELNVPLSIVRPSVVIGNSQTKKPGGSDTGLYGFIREMRRLKKALNATKEKVRIFADSDSRINFVPIDKLMNDLRGLIQAGSLEGESEIYHLASSNTPTTASVIHAICENLSIDNVAVESKQENESMSPIESLIEKRMIFYSSYMNSNIEFSRKIKDVHSVTKEDITGYIIEGVKALSGEDSNSFYKHDVIKLSDGVPINIYTAGNPKLPKVLICNAIGMPVEFVRPISERLLEKFSIVTFETRTLPSTLTDEHLVVDFSLDRQVKDVCEIALHLGMSSFNLLGWCSGANLAIHFANKYPECIDKISLMNGAYGSQLVKKTRFEENMQRIMPRISSESRLAEIVHSSIFSNDRTDKESELAQESTDGILSSTDPRYVHLTSVPFQSTSNLIRYANLITPHIESTMPDLSKMPPILVITGSDDITTSPESSRQLASLYENASFQCVENANHFSLYDNFYYMNVVSDFFSDDEDRQKIELMVNNILKKFSSHKLTDDELKPNKTLSELGIDSLSMLNVLLDFETALDVKLPHNLTKKSIKNHSDIIDVAVELSSGI